jgi:hypothetical protein
MLDIRRETNIIFSEPSRKSIKALCDQPWRPSAGFDHHPLLSTVQHASSPLSVPLNSAPSSCTVPCSYLCSNTNALLRAPSRSRSARVHLYVIHRVIVNPGTYNSVRGLTSFILLCIDLVIQAEGSLFLGVCVAWRCQQSAVTTCVGSARSRSPYHYPYAFLLRFLSLIHSSPGHNPLVRPCCSLPTLSLVNVPTSPVLLKTLRHRRIKRHRLPSHPHLIFTNRSRHLALRVPPRLSERSDRRYPLFYLCPSPNPVSLLRPPPLSLPPRHLLKTPVLRQRPSLLVSAGRLHRPLPPLLGPRVLACRWSFLSVHYHLLI